MSTIGFRKKRLILGIVLTVFGVVGLGAGLWGFTARIQSEAMLSRPDIALEIALRNGPGWDPSSALATLSAIGTVGFAAGAVLLILGLVVLAMLPRKESSSSGYREEST